MKTADIVVKGAQWEIKGPTGSSRKSTIKKQFNGLRQSTNLVIYGGDFPLGDKLALAQIKNELKRHGRARRLLYITSAGEIVVCK